jgi:hypothetical protein
MDYFYITIALVGESNMPRAASRDHRRRYYEIAVSDHAPPQNIPASYQEMLSIRR